MQEKQASKRGNIYLQPSVLRDQEWRTTWDLHSWCDGQCRRSQKWSEHSGLAHAREGMLSKEIPFHTTPFADVIMSFCPGVKNPWIQPKPVMFQNYSKRPSNSFYSQRTLTTGREGNLSFCAHCGSWMHGGNHQLFRMICTHRTPPRQTPSTTLSPSWIPTGVHCSLWHYFQKNPIKLKILSLRINLIILVKKKMLRWMKILEKIWPEKAK